jgi:hypothetical protein
MRSRKSIKNIPLFPFIPIVPAALLVGSLATAIGALLRVKNLERRFAADKIS